MSWTGRRLSSLTNGGTTGSYLYNADGIRIKKTVSDVTTDYFLNGSTILAEKTGSSVIWYIYDSDGEILGFTYNGMPYYYIKNVQGDVYKVVNASGTEVASYTYDPWGKVISSSGSMANINPIRYRSYYYDTETGFYYLQSRYYDPETGRFINADALLGSSDDVFTYNIFVYCGNDPVNCADPTGEYNRYAAIRYASQWYNRRNPKYYSYRYDCTNFVSQVVICKGWFLPPNTYDCGSFVVN